MQVNLGDRVKDIITGFEGIAVARTEWMYGCVRISVQPEKLTKGDLQEAKVFDEPQLKVVKPRALPNKSEPRTYGPRDDKLALKR